MHDIFRTNKTEPVLLVDAENISNSINKHVFWDNIKHLCAHIATFVSSCYNFPARLFVLGGKELLSHEGNTLGDPIYEIELTPLLKNLAACYLERDPKIVVFADDLTIAGRLSKLRSWWKFLLDVRPKYGYFLKPSKTILTVTPECESKGAEIFDNTAMERGIKVLLLEVNSIEKNTSKK